MKKLSSKCRILSRVVSMVRRNGLNTLTAAWRHWVYAILISQVLERLFLPLSSKPRASQMVFKGIMCYALVACLMSCKSLEPSISDTHNLSLIAHTSHHDTVLVHDSIFIREVQKGDTIFFTRTEYRDRWRVRLVHDTIRDTQYITQTIEHPPEKYIPKFYKWCTGLLWAILVLAIGRLALKLWWRV